MCEKCVEFNGKIEQCERLAASVGDDLTIDRMKGLIEEMKIQKAELHPE
jgi:hypothetical protein